MDVTGSRAFADSVWSAHLKQEYAHLPKGWIGLIPYFSPICLQVYQPVPRVSVGVSAMIPNMESPFFPWPVRWFEIKMEPPAWGFVRTTENDGETGARLRGMAPTSSDTEKVPAAGANRNSGKKSPGSILNARA